MEGMWAPDSTAALLAWTIVWCCSRCAAAEDSFRVATFSQVHGLKDQVFSDCLLFTVRARSAAECARVCMGRQDVKAFTVWADSPAEANDLSCSCYQAHSPSTSTATSAPGARCYALPVTAVPCPAPPKVSGASHSPALKSYTEPDVVTYTCSEERDGGSDGRRRCEADGTWTQETSNPQCDD